MPQPPEQRGRQYEVLDILQCKNRCSTSTQKRMEKLKTAKLELEMHILGLIGLSILMLTGLMLIGFLSVLHHQNQVLMIVYRYEQINHEMDTNQSLTNSSWSEKYPSARMASGNTDNYDLDISEITKVSFNPFNLNPGEIQSQLETAKVEGLKRRVKRFACWHSCFGPFRKKVLRKTTTEGPGIPTLATSSQSSLQSNDDALSGSEHVDNVAENTNQLGGDEVSSGNRRKKSPDPSEFYNAKPVSSDILKITSKPISVTNDKKVKLGGMKVVVKPVLIDKKEEKGDAIQQDSVSAEDTESESAESDEEDNNESEASESEETTDEKTTGGDDDGDGIDKEEADEDVSKQ